MTKKAPAKQPARGKLKSMRVSSGFREYVLDQLARFLAFVTDRCSGG